MLFSCFERLATDTKVLGSTPSVQRTDRFMKCTVIILAADWHVKYTIKKKIKALLVASDITSFGDIFFLDWQNKRLMAY